MARKRFPCPCCGQLTLDERGGYDICSVCNWEDDGDEHPWSISGPKHMSLWEGRVRWRDPGLSKMQRRRALEELRAAEAARRLPDHLAKLRRALGAPAGEMVDHEEAHRRSVKLWNDKRSWSSDRRTIPALTAALDGVRVPHDLEVVVLAISYDTLFGAPRTGAPRRRALVARHGGHALRVGLHAFARKRVADPPLQRRRRRRGMGRVRALNPGPHRV